MKLDISLRAPIDVMTSSGAQQQDWSVFVQTTDENGNMVAIKVSDQPDVEYAIGRAVKALYIAVNGALPNPIVKHE